MRQRGNGLVKVDAAYTSETEIPQERSHGGDQFLSRALSTLLGAMEQERPDVLRLPLADILAEGVQEIGGAATILPEGGFGRTSVPPKPFAE